jgi:hypothetical protein
MALAQEVIDLIRDEIGNDTDFVDNDAELGANPGALGSLEGIYTSEARGNSNPLVTALIVWRRRMNSLQARSFDVSTDGTLYARNQRVKFIQQKISRLELLVDTTHKGHNMDVVSDLLTLEDDPELSSRFAGPTLYPLY